MATGIKVYDWLAVHTWQFTFLQAPLLRHQMTVTALVDNGVKCVSDGDVTSGANSDITDFTDVCVHGIIAKCAAEVVVVAVSDAASVHAKSAVDAGEYTQMGQAAVTLHRGAQTQVSKFTTVRLHCGICFFGVTTFYIFVFIVKHFSSVVERQHAMYCYTHVRHPTFQ